MMRGIRGATTVTKDEPSLILEATETLVLEMAEKNDVAPEDIVSVIVSTTPDLWSVFPARAIRSIDGWKYVPVMCTHEMDVPGAITQCIRVMMNVNSTKTQREIEHIYQNEAVRLRTDLIEGEEK